MPSSTYDVTLVLIFEVLLFEYKCVKLLCAEKILSDLIPGGP